jgi:hypothetical protein
VLGLCESDCGEFWRRTQSSANFSPARFPANREKYREYLTLGRSHSEISVCRTVLCEENLGSRDQSEPGKIRESTGND